MDQYSASTIAAGIAGNLFAFVLFVSPMPTFRRIVGNESTEEFSGSPYVYSLMNCLICMWYGLPCVGGVVLVATVNSAGAVFQSAYVGVFIFYADQARKNLVIRTRSVEFMPFYLSLATTLMSLSFFVYGMLLHDFFIYIPNGIGALLGVVQLLLYGYYGGKSRERSILPLLA
ncbi:bidirectional sugar transporter SWEET2a-like isoform X1 [Zingiber officinale]|uniref:bidirectional sugar transporter SWEET2a-like isoform X1 n=1 Tax=Zingiber officinale TaxID=94328 RepID=UPI001C4C6636|nr:bidirectional sugar transporter SWEET2a-like isoform X1 [Zingiber officinale]